MQYLHLKSKLSKIVTMPFLLLMFGCGTSSDKEETTLNADSLVEKAYEFIWLYNNYDSAQSIFKYILKKEPSNERANNGIIEIMILKKDYHNAIRLTDSLISARPANYIYNITKGRIVEKLMSVDSAIHYYQVFLNAAGDTIWRTTPSLIAITEKRKLTKEELAYYGVDGIGYQNELLNYSNGGWSELYDNEYDTVLFYETELQSFQVDEILVNNGINYVSIAGGSSRGLKVYLKEKFVKNATDFGLTRIPVESK